jgi:hypothetical protein
MDLFVAGQDQSAANQPNNLAASHPPLKPLKQSIFARKQLKEGTYFDSIITWQVMFKASAAICHGKHGSYLLTCLLCTTSASVPKILEGYNGGPDGQALICSLAHEPHFYIL